MNKLDKKPLDFAGLEKEFAAAQQALAADKKNAEIAAALEQAVAQFKEFYVSLALTPPLTLIVPLRTEQPEGRPQGGGKVGAHPQRHLAEEALLAAAGPTAQLRRVQEANHRVREHDALNEHRGEQFAKKALDMSQEQNRRNNANMSEYELLCEEYTQLFKEKRCILREIKTCEEGVKAVEQKHKGEKRRGEEAPKNSPEAELLQKEITRLNKEVRIKTETSACAGGEAAGADGKGRP